MPEEQLCGFRDLKGQIHVHSYLSHDSRGSLKEIAAAANATGAKWVILTDHLSARPNLSPKLLTIIDGVTLIYGQEIILKDQGSELKIILPKLSRQFRAHGHIEKYKGGDNQKWDAIELVNFHANAVANPIKLLIKLILRPHKYKQLLSFVPEKNLEYWGLISRRQNKPIPIFAATDAHANLKILGITLNSYESLFQQVSTHIWLPPNQPLTEKNILESIKAGRTYIAFDYLGDSTNKFQFFAQNKEGQCSTEAIVDKPKGLAITNKLKNSKTAVFWNNILVNQYENLPRIEIKNPKPGFWRVAIYKDGLPWIISRQILIK